MIFFLYFPEWVSKIINNGVEVLEQIPQICVQIIKPHALQRFWMGLNNLNTCLKYHWLRPNSNRSFYLVSWKNYLRIKLQSSKISIKIRKLVGNSIWTKVISGIVHHSYPPYSWAPCLSLALLSFCLSLLLFSATFCFLLALSQVPIITCKMFICYLQ